MVKTHEIKLTTTNFNQFDDNDYIIVNNPDDKIEQNDYILFKQIEMQEEQEIDTGLYRMTQVEKVIKDVGLKEGYVLLILNKL